MWPFKKKTNLFDLIIGKKLLNVREPELVEQPSYPGAEEYTNCGLGFSGNCGLAIENKYSFVNANKLNDLVGEKVIKIVYADDYVEFAFSNNKKIIVSLKAEDWPGPEAMQLYYKDKIIIWN